MTSQHSFEIAAPPWGLEHLAHVARAPARREARRAVPATVFPPRRALELRVHRPRLAGATMGAVLALGFVLLWAFLLLGVVAPASALG